MSLPSSDFGDVGFEEAYEESPAIEAAPAAPNYRPRGFSIYTVMLILSTVFLTAAAIIVFLEADKY